MNYPIINGIPDFRTQDSYWCNVSRVQMNEVNRLAKKYGWLTAVDKLIPEYRSAFLPYARADAQYLYPIRKDSIVLDAGSMWGGLTIPIAQNCRQIYAVDKTRETLEFLKIRAEQMGFTNIHTIAADLDALPFTSHFFDIIILNGVLEWVGMLQDINLESYWAGHIVDTTKYIKSPTSMQLAVLRELRRVLKPSGVLCLAIENRYGAQYLMGYPDDHVNIRYVSLLPRWVANIITKHIRGCEYRAYTYSLTEYQKLLAQSGFTSTQFYGSFLHYIAPETIVPVEIVEKWKEIVLPDRPIVKIFPSSWLKYVAPSYIVIAGQEQFESRIFHMLKEVNLLRCQPKAIVKLKSRLGNYNTVNFLVYAHDKEIPTYFCKICRDNKHTDILIDEARNLNTAYSLLERSEIRNRIPKMLFFGVIDNITIMVQKYMWGQESKFNPQAGASRSNLAKLDRDIRAAIEFLVQFQKDTSRSQIDAQQLIYIIEQHRYKLDSLGILAHKDNENIERILLGLRTQTVSIPLCAVHGDFDFYTNILFDNRKAQVVDFESFCPEGLPALDLTMLIFNAIIVSYRRCAEHGWDSLSMFIDRFSTYIRQWMALYSSLSGISLSVVQYFPHIAVLEQMAKDYPYYRDPESYPLHNYEVFSELLSRQDNA